MRLFLGLDIDSTECRALSAWRERFAPASGHAVPAANYHITTAFIGDVTSNRLDSLCGDVDRHMAAGRRSRLQLHMDQIGYWPRPGIYWLGMRTVPPALQQLAKVCAKVARAQGTRSERREYTPHITLYRGVEQPPPAPIQEPAIAIDCQYLSLFESITGRSGVQYRIIADWELRAT